MTKVESFSLNHDVVKVPYVRLAGSETKENVSISKFDLRLVQPNVQEIPTAAIHTLEHMLASYLRDHANFEIIDISPMGCRTGFYMVVWGVPTQADVAITLKLALEDVLETQWHEVQGTKRQECGNYRDHSLHGAKEYAKQVLEQSISLDPFDNSTVV